MKHLSLKGAVIAALLLVSTANASEVPIDRILPPVSALGNAWTSNRVVLLIDPLSSPSAVADSRDVPDPEAALRITRELMRKSHRVGQAVVRYYLGVRQCGVFISRFDSKSSAEANWAKPVTEERTATVSLSSPVGERFRFSNRHGMHNGLSFLRGHFCITVECGLDEGWEEIKHLARAIDEMLLKESPVKGN